MRHDLNPYSPLRAARWENSPRIEAVAQYLIRAGVNKIIAYAIAYVGVTAVTSWALRALAPMPEFGAVETGLLTNSRGATAAQQLIYGEVRKGGTITFIESNGTNNEYLHQIICLAGHEVNAIGDIYINDQVVTLDNDGNVTSSDWQDSDGNSTILIQKFTGAANQNVYSTLSALTDGPSWQGKQTGDDTNFRGQGIACLYVRLKFDQDVFSQGVPLFTAKVQGKKVYDPRSSTTAYSANAALCVRDYLVSKYGLNNSGAVNDTSFSAAANTCDESVTLSGSGTESRYEINGVVSLDKSPGDILADMMTACAGTLFWGAGNWQLKVGEYTTAVKTFTLDDFRSAITLDTKHSRRDNFNIVRGTFVDASSDYVRADYPEIKGSTFISNDNGIESAIDLSLPLTTSGSMAQRLAKMTLFRAREQMTLTADFGMEAFEVQVGDIVGITNSRYGWTAKEFEVVGWKFGNNGDEGEIVISLTLRETSSAAFDWNAEEEEIDNNNTTLADPRANLNVSGVTVTDKGSIQEDGTFIGQALVNWTKGTNEFLTAYEVQWKDVDESVYLTTEVPASESSVIIGPLETGTQYNIRVRGRTVAGVRGTWVAATPYTHGGDTTAPSSVTSLTATGGPKIVTLDWTAPTTDSDASTLYDLKGYNVYRATTNSQPASPIAFSGSDKYVDGGLAASTSYYYWVTAVDFTGNESTAVASGSVTTDAPVSGVDSDTRIYTGKVYYQTLQASAPSTPTATSFSETTLTFGGLSSGWADTQPIVDATNTTVKEWSSKYKVVYDADDNETISFTTPDGAFQITDDLESDNYVTGSSGWRIERDTGNAEFQNATIRGTLDASDITAGTISVARLPGLTNSDVVSGGDTSRFDQTSTANSTSAIRTALGFSAQTMYRYNNFATLSGVTSGSTLIGTATLTIEKNAGSDPSGMNTCFFVLYDGSTVVTSPCTNTVQTGSVTLNNSNNTATFTAALAIEGAASGTATMGFYFSGGSPDEDEMSADAYSFSVIEFTK